MLLLSPVANAELFGLPHGRSANPGSLPPFSIEVAFVGGEFIGSDYRNIGVRANYRLGRKFTVYGDFSFNVELGDGGSEIGTGVGHPIGIGVYFYNGAQPITNVVDLAWRISAHRGSVDGNSIINAEYGDTNYGFWNIEALLSGQKPITESGLNWYSNFGLRRSSIEYVGIGDNNGFGFVIGIGTVLPVGPGVVYADAQFARGLQYSIGYRYLVQ